MKLPHKIKPLVSLMGLAPGMVFAMAFLGTNMSVQVQGGLGSNLTVTGLTQANPGVATSTAHGLTNGDVVVFTVTAGMVELNQQVVRVANVTANTFELESIDTSGYTAWSAGVVNEVTSWHTLSNAQSVSMPDATPNKIDITTLIDKVKQIAFGLPEAPDGSMGTLFDPLNAGVLAIQAATEANTTLAFRVNWADGHETLFNALVSGGSGFDLQQNDVAKATIAFSPQKLVRTFAP